MAILGPATEEQAQVDASALEKHSNEAAAVAGLLAFQGSILVLRDLAVEAVERSPEEEEERRRALRAPEEPRPGQ